MTTQVNDQVEWAPVAGRALFLLFHAGPALVSCASSANERTGHDLLRPRARVPIPGRARRPSRASICRTLATRKAKVGQRAQAPRAGGCPANRCPPSSSRPLHSSRSTRTDGRRVVRPCISGATVISIQCPFRVSRDQGFSPSFTSTPIRELRKHPWIIIPGTVISHSLINSK